MNCKIYESKAGALFSLSHPDCFSLHDICGQLLADDSFQIWQETF